MNQPAEMGASVYSLATAHARMDTCLLTAIVSVQFISCNHICRVNLCMENKFVNTKCYRVIYFRLLPEKQHMLEVSQFVVSAAANLWMH